MPNNNGKSVYETMYWLTLRIYKNRKDKFEVIPITAVNAKISRNGNVQIKEKELNDILESRNIDISQKNNYKTLNYGDIIRFNNTNYYVKGHSYKERKLELSRLQVSNEKQKHWTLNTQLIGAEKIVTSPLGQVINKSKIL